MKYIILLLLSFNILLASTKSCDDTLFSFGVNGTSQGVRILDIVENVAHQCQFSVMIKDDKTKDILNQKLFIVHIKDYTLDAMFDYLFSKHNMFFEYDDNKKLLKISYLQTRSFMVDYVNFTEQSTESTKSISIGASSSTSTTSSDTTTSSGGSGGNSDNTVVTAKSQFIFWDKLASEIDSILLRDGDSNKKIGSRAIINREAGIVTITGTKNQINRISSYLEKIKDRLHKQVVLETKLIEVSYSKSSSTGIDWSKFSMQLKGSVGQLWSSNGNSNSNSFSYDFSIDGLLSFLKKQGTVNLLSTPKVMTLNNQPAVINVGQQINYRYQNGTLTTASAVASSTNTYEINSVFVGLTLNVVPEITDDGFIILRVNPVVSEQDLTNPDNNIVDTNGVRIMPPDIKIKQISSIIKVKNGKHVVIGGLVSVSKSSVTHKVPLLGDIPVLGWLFKNKTDENLKTELIIVITPKIINNDNFPSIGKVENLIDGTLNE